MAANQPSVNRYRKPKTPIVIPERVARRAHERRVEQDSGCWISTYSTASHGYAQIGWQDAGGRHVVTAHRAAWVHHTGQQIPDGVTIDHTCKNKPCVNPEHLRMTSNFENARRTSGRDWPMGECANGHPNSELEWTGQRYRCRPCNLEAQRKYREKNRAKVREADRRYREKKKLEVAARP